MQHLRTTYAVLAGNVTLNGGRVLSCIKSENFFSISIITMYIHSREHGAAGKLVGLPVLRSDLLPCTVPCTSQVFAAAARAAVGILLQRMSTGHETESCLQNYTGSSVRAICSCRENFKQWLTSNGALRTSSTTTVETNESRISSQIHRPGNANESGVGPS